MKKSIDLYLDYRRLMRLRTNKALKFFALLLFSLEFLAPAMLIQVEAPMASPDQVLLLDGTRHQTMLNSIVSEEMSETEEERESHINASLITDFNFEFDVLEWLGLAPAAFKNSTLLSNRFETQPALFTLHCNFRI